MAEKPDAIFCGSFTDEAPTILTQFRGAGLDMTMLSGDGWDAQSIPDMAGAASNNTYYSS